MSLFKKEGNKLIQLKNKPIDLERNVQKLTEDNLQEIFGLTFIETEFSVQNFRFDTIAFDESTKSFVIIEYKKDKNISVVDQALAYLSTMLNNKAEFLLVYQEKLNKIIKKEEVEWSQSRIILIADSFTKYQENAIGFKDLPIELYEVKLYENELIAYNQIKSNLGKIAPLTTIKLSKNEEDVLREVKEYTLDYHFGNWKDSRKLFDNLKIELNSLGDLNEKITKYYIAYSKEDTNKSFVEIVGQKKGLKIYLRPTNNELRSPHLQLIDCHEIGHWTNGNTVFQISKKEDIPYALDLIKQAYDLVYSNK